jgi:hypothetical protein
MAPFLWLIRNEGILMKREDQKIDTLMAKGIKSEERSCEYR